MLYTIPMSIHRTKEQKISAQLKREQLYSLGNISSSQTEKLAKKEAPIVNTTLITYPEKLIIQDLLRTVISLIIVVGLLGFAWWYLR